MSQALENRFAAQLAEREAQGALRRLTLAQPGRLDLFSNDYLGLATDPILAEEIEQAWQDYKQHNPWRLGATGSRLLSGHSQLAQDLEDELAAFFQAEAALLFPSGYAAGIALLSTLPQKGDLILADEYIHACLKEGARLSFAARTAFRHNDLGHLAERLSAYSGQGQIFVVTESVFSMDGDTPDLPALAQLCQQNQANLLVDEAHGIGVFGAQGEGLCLATGMASLTQARMYTFGKAPGTHGAVIVGSARQRDYLINYARPLIYTTSLPDHSLIALRTALRYMARQENTRISLFQRVEFMAQAINQLGLTEHFLPIQTPIVILKAPGNHRARRWALALQEAGFELRPVLSPTIPEGQERIRLCLHAHTPLPELQRLLGVVQSLVA